MDSIPRDHAMVEKDNVGLSYRIPCAMPTMFAWEEIGLDWIELSSVECNVM